MGDPARPYRIPDPIDDEAWEGLRKVLGSEMEIVIEVGNPIIKRLPRKMLKEASAVLREYCEKKQAQATRPDWDETLLDFQCKVEVALKNIYLVHEDD